MAEKESEMVEKFHARAEHLHERAAACISACSGIPTGMLREGIVGELRDATRELMRLHPDCGSADGPIARIENKMRALLKELEP